MDPSGTYISTATQHKTSYMHILGYNKMYLSIRHGVCAYVGICHVISPLSLFIYLVTWAIR